MSFLLALVLSTTSFAADWQCGKYADGHFQLDSDNYYKYLLVPASESADDFLAGFKGERLCVKGRAITSTRATLVIYDAKAE
ncbi:MAG: hypothetical protein ACXWQO_11470 [Bdellovibrionota bacterium]